MLVPFCYGNAANRNRNYVACIYEQTIGCCRTVPCVSGGGVITNITGITRRRVDMVFSIGYNDDIEKAQTILEEIVNGHELVLKEPEAIVRLHELADSSVNFTCRPWVRPEDYWNVYWDITREVKRRFYAGNVSIPFPQRDVHIYQESTR